MGTAPAAALDKNEWREVSPKNVLTLLMLLGMIIGTIGAGYSTYDKANKAATKEEVNRLSDDVKEIKGDVKKLLERK